MFRRVGAMPDGARRRAHRHRGPLEHSRLDLDDGGLRALDDATKIEQLSEDVLTRPRAPPLVDQWSAISDEQFLSHHRRILRQLEEVPVAEPARQPDPAALQLVDRIGELWEGMTVEERAAFVAEWFAEARIGADGGVEWVAREPYFAIVAASLAPREVRTVGSTGLEPPMRTYAIRLAGIEDWLSRQRASAAASA